MGVIKLVEDYAVTQLRKDVRDSLTMAGEVSVLLKLFHAEDPDSTPCPQCGDDIYKSPEKDCTSCYGTMFDGGVKQALRVRTLFTDHQVNEQLGPRGVYEPDHRHVQFESFPLVTEHDVVVRVRHWDRDTPTELEGYYLLDKVDRRSLRTGTRFGQYGWDVVGQKADLAELPDKMGMITNYPILGQAFEEALVLNQNGTPTSATIVVEGGHKKYATPVGDGTTTLIPVVHGLGTLDVGVTLYDAITGEEVDTDVVHATPHSITLNFAVAPALAAYRCVVLG